MKLEKQESLFLFVEEVWTLKIVNLIALAFMREPAKM